MSGVDGEARGRSGVRPWLIAGLVCAVAATAALVFSQDVRWLRLGIVAALWAALLGAFLAGRYRRQADHALDEADQAQELYELELEREIAARREFELEVESELRRDLEAESRSDLDSLRAEIATLRSNLERLLGGEFTYERVALTAQSTRMRPPRYDQSYLPSGESDNGDKRKLLSPAYSLDEGLAEQRTELISKVFEAGLSASQPIKRMPTEPPREHRPEPPREYRPEPPPATPAASPKRQPEPSPKRRSEPAREVRPSAEAPLAPVAFHEPPPTSNGDLSARFAKQFDLDWRPSWEESFPPGDAPSWTSSVDADTPSPSSETTGATDQPSWDAFEPTTADAGNGNSTLPERALEIQRENRPGGRRRKPEAEDEPDPLRVIGGRHSHPADEREPAAPSGAHGAGRSVADLLAAHGAAETPRRHRRKE